jgi:hypothetical protein
MNKAWQPYNVKAITNNIKLIFKTGDINKLNGPTYKVISLYMGFIAHYGLNGFRGTYNGKLALFARNLITGEGGIHNYGKNANWGIAMQHINGHWREQGGMTYQRSIGNAMLGILAEATAYLTPGKLCRWCNKPIPAAELKKHPKTQWHDRCIKEHNLRSM